jgi:hypothetical protein
MVSCYYVSNQPNFISCLGHAYTVTFFTPSDIAGMELWLKSDEGIVLNGSNVSSWQDQSGNSNNALQANPAFQVPYITNVLNGYPALRFSPAGGTFLALPSIKFRTMFIVFKPNIAATFLDYRGILGGPNSDSNVGGYLLFGFAASSDIVQTAGGSFNRFTVVRRNGIDVMLSPWSYGGNFNAINSFSYGSFVYTIEREQSADIGRIDAGMFAARYMDGDIVEMLVYDSELSSINISMIEVYLAGKYAL